MSFLANILRVLPFAGLLAGASAAPAAELHLFDGDDCTGEVRMLDRSVENLRAIGFDNRVGSLMVLSGHWRFFRDAGYRSGNGPAFAVATSDGGAACLSVANASGGAFPPDLMSAVRLEQETGHGAPAGVAVLYDGASFSGEYRMLTRDVSDFRIIGFDNRVASVKVLKGRWSFYRNPGFGEAHDRPSVILAPGDYPDIAAVPGYPARHFPRNLMSSARLVAATQPPPPAQAACQPGQIPGDAQCHYCWDYFGNTQYSSWPVSPGKNCACAYGHRHKDQLTAVSDGVTFRDCVPE